MTGPIDESTQTEKFQEQSPYTANLEDLGTTLKLKPITPFTPATDEQLTEAIFNTLECKEPQTKRFIKILLDNIRLFDKKQHDYGPMNIAKFSWTGVMIRLSDKLERMINLWNKDETDEAECENLIDTWQDIANYGVIGHMCYTGIWEEYKND